MRAFAGVRKQSRENDIVFPEGRGHFNKVRGSFGTLEPFSESLKWRFCLESINDRFDVDIACFKLERLHPNSKKEREELGNAALEAMTRCIERHGAWTDNFGIHHDYWLRGKIHAKLGNYEKAAADLEKSISAFPAVATEEFLRLADIYSKLNNKEKEAEYREKVRKRVATNREYWVKQFKGEEPIYMWTTDPSNPFRHYLMIVD